MSDTRPASSPTSRLRAEPAASPTRYRILQKAGGLVAPLLTVLLAFLISGARRPRHDGSSATRSTTYRAIFNGSGLDWFFHVGSHTSGFRSRRARLVPVEHRRRLVSGGREPPADAHPLDGARSHRARSRVRVPLRPLQHRRAGPVSRGLDRRGFRRHGASAVVDLPGVLLIVVAVARRDARGRGPRGHRRLSQGNRRRARGDHDDHAQLDRHLGRLVPLRPRRAASERDVRPAPSHRRRTFRRRRSSSCSGATRCSRGSTSASSSRFGALLVYSLVLNRTTLGYEVRAVGHNPEAARYGGISVARNYFLAMAIAGVVRRPRRSARRPRLGVPASTSRRSRAPRSGSSGSPSRCSAGTPRSASVSRRSCSPRSRPGRRRATSTRASSRPSSRTQPRRDHPGAHRALRRRRRHRPPRCSGRLRRNATTEGGGSVRRLPRGWRRARRGPASSSACSQRSWRCRRSRSRSPVVPVVDRPRGALRSASVRAIRGRARIGGYAIAAGVLGLVIGYLATRSSIGNLEHGRRLGCALRRDAPLRDAAAVRLPGRPLLGALGRREHRPRGNDAAGAFFAVWGADVTGTGCSASRSASARGGLMGLLHAFFSISPARRPDRRRHCDQLPCARI